MRFYDRYILPKLVHFACGMKPNMRQREKVVPLATGDVLEVGVGSGLNFPYYDSTKVRKVWALEPSSELLDMARLPADASPFEVEFVGLPIEEMPLEDGTVDTVLVTYALCTIPSPVQALRRMARVLRPGGRLIFCEHGASPDVGVRRWQDRLNPLWRRFAGGCELNRPIPDLIKEGGFRVVEMETMYLPGWRPASFNYWGAAIAG